MKDGIINQHNLSSQNDNTYGDFAHMSITIATYLNEDDDSLGRTLVDELNKNQVNDEILTNYMSGFLGDIYSGRMDISDMISDVDAQNVYYLITSNNYTVADIHTNYLVSVNDGNINRKELFFESLGNGDSTIGRAKLASILQSESYGALYLSTNIDRPSRAETIDELATAFLDWLEIPSEKQDLYW